MAKKTESVPALQPAGNLTTVPVDYDVLMQDAGQRTDQLDARDMSIPYILMLQSLSPQLSKSKDKYIPGAESGDLLNTLTNDLYKGDEGIKVIPCAITKAWVEWKPRSSGGGFVASHGNDSLMAQTEKDSLGYDVLPNGNLLAFTYYYYVLLVTDRGAEPAVISMTRTQTKKARKWNSLMSTLMVNGPKGQFNPPKFSQQYILTTVSETNTKGDFFNFEVSRADPPLVEDAELYAKAKAFSTSVMSGAVSAPAMPVDKSDEEHDAF